MSVQLNITYLWLDDVRPLCNNESYAIGVLHDYNCVVARSVNEAIRAIIRAEQNGQNKFILNLDHDLGDYAKDGGDGYKLVEWLIETGRNTNNYQVCCHSMNPVGKEHIIGLRDRYWEPFNEEEFFNE